VAIRSKRVSWKAISKDTKRTSKLIGLRPFPIFLLPAYRHGRSFIKNVEIIGSNATGLDTLWFSVDKPKSKLDPVYPI
jgi:hypothetical protein